MFNLAKNTFMLPMLVLYGPWMHHILVPLLASWFGITVTIAGAGIYSSWYLVMLTSFFLTFGIIGLIWLILTVTKNNF